MKITTLKSIISTLMIAFFLMSCFGSDRGTDLGNGDIGPTTNSLASPINMDLILDQMTFEGNISSRCGANNNACLEIHIMDEDADTLLACVGWSQSLVMRYMGKSYLTYGDLRTQFAKSAAAVFANDTNITVRLINKASSSVSTSCPSGYNTDSTSTANKDYILAATTTTYGELLANGVEFENYGETFFRTAADEPLEVAVTASAENGQVVLDQLRLDDEDLSPNEYTNPEVALVLAEHGSLDVIGCADLVDINYGGNILYGTMNYGLVDASGIAVNDNDLDETTEYWVLLVERDGGSDCADSLLSNYAINAQTEALTYATLINQPNVEFENGEGEFTLILQ